ncbi:YdcF family protein [Candidatus Dojkabacteria bacterium]|nr:YdcF family protein [Candidatus Dojkabacteria bacterium]
MELSTFENPESLRTKEIDAATEFIVVHGGGVTSKPMEFEGLTTYLGGFSMVRTLAAIEYAKYLNTQRDQHPIIIVTGGYSNAESNITEAQAMAMVVHHYLPEQVVLQERQSIDTWENVLLLKELLIANNAYTKIQDENTPLTVLTSGNTSVYDGFAANLRTGLNQFGHHVFRSHIFFESLRQESINVRVIPAELILQRLNPNLLAKLSQNKDFLKSLINRIVYHSIEVGSSVLISYLGSLGIRITNVFARNLRSLAERR